jgi:hypothetical protein
MRQNDICISRIITKKIEQSENLGWIKSGPAVITDAGETVVIDRSWRAKVDASGDLVASRIAPRAMRVEAAEQELFAARLEAIAPYASHDGCVVASIVVGPSASRAAGWQRLRSSSRRSCAW